METVFGDIVAELRDKAPEFFVAVAVLLGLMALGQGVGMGMARVLGRARRGDRYARLARRITGWAFTLFGILLALQILGYTAVATSVLATGGVAAIVLGFAFKDIGENLLAGVFLAFSRSFDVGDLIESGGLRGVVRAIDLRATHIRTADGCDIFIPSSQIFRQPLMNFTRDGLRRGSFTIGVDYGDEPDRAIEVMRGAISATRGVLQEPAPTFELTEFAGSWMELRAHLWVDIRDPERSDASLTQVRTRSMTASRKALLAAGFTLSSDTTTALSVPSLDVRLEPPAESVAESTSESRSESDPPEG